ncbi:MAG: pentapeptide repeat-containing protein [bacterium]|nr:pentapeptide repeat-containing protein [bacterium]
MAIKTKFFTIFVMTIILVLNVYSQPDPMLNSLDDQLKNEDSLLILALSANGFPKLWNEFRSLNNFTEIIIDARDYGKTWFSFLPELLINADLSYFDFRNITFRNFHFGAITLNSANLQDAIFENCNLQGATGQDIIVSDTQFINSNLNSSSVEDEWHFIKPHRGSGSVYLKNCSTEYAAFYGNDIPMTFENSLVTDMYLTDEHRPYVTYINCQNLYPELLEFHLGKIRESNGYNRFSPEDQTLLNKIAELEKLLEECSTTVPTIPVFTVKKSPFEEDRTEIIGAKKALLGSALVTNNHDRTLIIKDPVVMLSPEEAASISNLYLGNASGDQLSGIIHEVREQNSFEYSFPLAPSVNQRVCIYGDINEDAEKMEFSAAISFNAREHDSQSIFGYSASILQTISFQKNGLIVRNGAYASDLRLPFEGNDIHVAQYVFKALGESYIISDLMVTTEMEFYFNVEYIILEFKRGIDTHELWTVFRPSPSEPSRGEAIFQGINLKIPAEEEVVIDIYIYTFSKDEGAIAGTHGEFSLDTSERFAAVSNSGEVTNILFTSSDLSSIRFFMPTE